MKRISILALLIFVSTFWYIQHHASQPVNVTDTKTSTKLDELEITTIEEFNKENDIPVPSDSDEKNKKIAIKKETRKPVGLIKVPDSQEKTYRALGTETYSDWEQIKINQEEMHQQSKGNGVIVAIIDSGLALNHEDLNGAWFINEGETGMTQPGDFCYIEANGPEDKSTNGCDDDGNTLDDDWRGYDFTNQGDGPDNDVSPGESGLDPMPSSASHGTLVASVVGSRENSMGAIGVAPEVTIMPLQALEDNGLGQTSAVVSAIYYATDMGADVINMSLGGGGDDPNMQVAIDYATANGVVVVAASGNYANLCSTTPEDPICGGLEGPGYMTYPAADSNVIAVGATNQNDTRTTFSSYGAELDLVAPGAALGTYASWSTDNQTNRYSSNLYGTSFAAPIVSGQIANLLSLEPNLNYARTVELIKYGTDKIVQADQNGFNIEYGYGRIDLTFSLNQIVPSATITENSSPNNAENIVELRCQSAPNRLCLIELSDANSKTLSKEIKTDQNGVGKILINRDEYASPIEYSTTVQNQQSMLKYYHW